MAVISAIASATGTGVSIAASNKTRQEQNRVLTDQLLKQREFGQQGQQLFTKSLEQSATPAALQRIDAGANYARSLFESLRIPQGQAPVSSRALSQITQQEENESKRQGYAGL